MTRKGAGRVITDIAPDIREMFTTVSPITNVEIGAKMGNRRSRFREFFEFSNRHYMELSKSSRR